MEPGAVELGGGFTRFELRKRFHGDLEGSGSGIMLSAGDPATGSAGYIAAEVVSGSLAGRAGTFAMVQLGLMDAGAQHLQYRIVPGSGEGDLAGISGELHLSIDDDGTHRYELHYEV